MAKRKQIHDGKRVAEALRISRVDQKQFAKDMNVALRTLQRKLETSDWTTGELVRAERILPGFDPFGPYTQRRGIFIGEFIPVPQELTDDHQIIEWLRETLSGSRPKPHTDEQ